LSASINFYKETNFKEDSEIGKIPNNWGVIRLGDKEIAKVIMGQSPPSNTYNEKGEGLPFLQGKLEFGEIYPSPVTYCSNPIKIAEQGDILISVRAPVGDVNLAPYRLCIGRGLAAIRFNPKKASSWFYFYYLQRVKNFLENLGKGSTFKAINKDDLASLKIAFPPLPEQERVAEVLFAVDLAVQKVDEAIARVERLKKGLMQQLLTKGIGHKEFKQTPIGKIPKHWELKELKNVAKVVSGFTFPLKLQGRRKGKYPFVKVGDMSGFHKYVISADNYVDDMDIEKLRGKPFPKGTIIFPKIGMAMRLNRYRILGVDALFDNNVAGIIPREIDNEFLYYYLSGKVDLFKLAGTTTVPSITKNTLESLKIPYPSLTEQRKIGDVLSSVDNILFLKERKKEKLVQMKRRLMDLLLTGKVRVSV